MNYDSGTTSANGDLLGIVSSMSRFARKVISSNHPNDWQRKNQHQSTKAIHGVFRFGLCQHELMKADLRISFKDYSRRKSFKPPWKWPVPSAMKRGRRQSGRIAAGRFPVC